MILWDHVMYSPDPYGKYEDYRQAKSLTPHLRFNRNLGSALTPDVQPTGCRVEPTVENAISNSQASIPTSVNLVATQSQSQAVAYPPLVASSSTASPIPAAQQDAGARLLRPRSKLRLTERATKIYRL